MKIVPEECGVKICFVSSQTDQRYRCVESHACNAKRVSIEYTRQDG